MRKPSRLRRFVLRGTVTLCIVAWLATLGLGVASYWWRGQWDLSVHGERCLFVQLAQGHMTMFYAGRDDPPLLSAKHPTFRVWRGTRFGTRLLDVLLTPRGVDREIAEGVTDTWIGSLVVESPRLAEWKRFRLVELRRARCFVNNAVVGLAQKSATLGFFVHVARTPVTEVVVRMPLWPLLIVFGIAPMVAWGRRRVRIRAERRRRSNRCVACDYDLRGNVSGVCPECGKAI